MTVPGIPVSPVIEKLRRAISDYHEEHGVIGPASDLIDAACGVLTEYDMQVDAVRVMQQRHAVSETNLAAMRSFEPPKPVTVAAQVPWVDPWSEQQASGGAAKGTLDP